MDKRDVGLFRADWGCTCPSPGRLQTISSSTDVDGPRMLPVLTASSLVDLFDKPASRLRPENN